MVSVLVGLLSIALLLLVVIGSVVICFVLVVRKLWKMTRPNQAALRGVIIVCVLGVIASPYVMMKLWERSRVLSRVPTPLVISEIEYRLEESWGIGGPGDNETGFVIYRLTDASAEWARSQGDRLAAVLEGSSRSWRATPIDYASDEQAFREWSPEEWGKQLASGEKFEPRIPTLLEYLDKYGFDIPIESGKDVDVNQAIQSPGSFYKYGNGGSVTIVDPKRGKVYFAYAG